MRNKILRFQKVEKDKELGGGATVTKKVNYTQKLIIFLFFCY